MAACSWENPSSRHAKLLIYNREISFPWVRRRKRLYSGLPMDSYVTRPTDIKAAVAAAFSKAAHTYDDDADVQRNAAQGVTERIGALPLPSNPRILEIGCGTGFLSATLNKLAG